MKKQFILLASVIAVVSCQKDADHNATPAEIGIRANVSEMRVTTKAPIEQSLPSSDNPVTAAIWASTTSLNYQGTQGDEPEPGTDFIDYHNSTCFTSDAKQLLDHKLFYPDAYYEGGEKKAKSVYFIGLCPRSSAGWSAPYCTTHKKYDIAHCTFDGSIDVMYAPEVHNSVLTSTQDPILEFRHILTWLKFNIVSAEDGASEAWGPIESITVASCKEVDIDFTDTTYTFTNPIDMPTYCINKGVCTDVEFSGMEVELTDSPQTVSYVLCASVNALATADDEYYVTVNTVGGRTATAKVNLKDTNNYTNFAGFTGGCQFTVNLRFGIGDVIVTTARATQWVNAGIGVAPITE